jgi:maltooligosyltrehalose trehalohydrolase
MLLAPHVPLLFMGEEYGEEQPFLFFCSFEDKDLVENIRIGRRQEFAAFHTQDVVPDPQAVETFRASCLTWSWKETPHKAGLRRLYQDLLRVRTCWPALKNFTQRAAQCLPGQTPHALLELMRGARIPKGGETLHIYFNLTGVPQPFTPVVRPAETLLFSSEAEIYAGTRSTIGHIDHLHPHECVVLGPASWPSLVR